MRSLQPNVIHYSWSETGKPICLSWLIKVVLLLLSLQSRLHVILRPKNHFLPPLLIEASWVVRWPDKDVRKHRQRKSIMTEENLELQCNLEIEYPRQCIMNWYFSWRQCRYKSFFESMWRFLFSWKSQRRLLYLLLFVPNSVNRFTTQWWGSRSSWPSESLCFFRFGWILVYVRWSKAKLVKEPNGHSDEEVDIRVTANLAFSCLSAPTFMWAWSQYGSCKPMENMEYVHSHTWKF